MSGEHFIPFRSTDIVSMCADDLPTSQRAAFASFAHVLSSLVHQRFHARIEALKDAYHPFDRDADTRTVGRLSPDQRSLAQERLEEELAALAVAANYTPVDMGDVARAMREHSLLKVSMTVDMSVIDKVMFFRRGESVRTRRVRTWLGLRRREAPFTNFARVLVYARFKGVEHFAGTDLEHLPYRPGSIIVKLFQNVPRDDLEMVFPNVQVRLRLFDKVLFGVPALVSGVIVIATKLAASLGLLVLLFAFWMGLSHRAVVLSQTELISIGAGLVAFGGYLLRQVSKFMNRKIRFMKALSENLYFRNLDNDAGVFHHMLDAAEEAEVIEAVLAYHFLRTAPDPLTDAELDQRIEAWFATHWSEHLDFDVVDGMRKLREFGLIAEDGEGRSQAISLDEARARLGTIWQGLLDEPTDRPADIGTAVTRVPGSRVQGSRAAVPEPR